MNTHKQINGTELSLDGISPQTEHLIRLMTTDATSAIRDWTRVALRQHFGTFGSLWSSHIPHPEYALPEDTIALEVFHDLHHRIAIAAGLTDAPADAAEDLHAKERTGRPEEPVNVFHMGKSRDEDSTIGFHLSLIRPRDSDDGDIETILRSIHDARDTVFIGFIANLSQNEDRMLTHLRKKYGAEIVNFMLHAFKIGFECARGSDDDFIASDEAVDTIRSSVEFDRFSTECDGDFKSLVARVTTIAFTACHEAKEKGLID